MELKDYWRTIRRRWRVVVATLLLVLAAAAVFTWQATPKYSSTARLFVSTTTTDLTALNAGNTLATDRVQSYADLVNNNHSLAVQVSEALGGAVSADTLQSEIKATVKPQTVNLDITATDPDPARARDIAQDYAESLSTLVSSIEAPRDGQAAPIRASVVDNAQVATSPTSPNVVRNLGLGVVLGLLLGIGLAVLREILDTSITTVDDVASVTSAPILGDIHQDAAAIREPGSVTLRRPTPWAEAFRVLRTNMQFVEVDHERRMFVVSSSLPGEGKTTTVTNLAITMAMAGQKVCLVECDLRRPRVAEVLGIDDAVGTTSVLIGQVKIEDALQEYADTGLWVLASGPRPPNPSELLQSNAMTEMIAELRERFDMVLLDAPPLLPVTDAALLAAQADGLLCVSRHGKTTHDQLRHALERVEAVDGKCVGVVMNMTPARKRGRGYGYGYGYGYEPVEAKGSRRRDKSAADA